MAGERGSDQSGASVVLSNELLDAFAPVKLRLSLFGSPDVADCHSWQEIRVVHSIQEADLRQILAPLFSPQRVSSLLEELHAGSRRIFCSMVSSSIGKAAMERMPPGTSCHALVFGLAELMYRVDLRVPASSHNMRFRLKKDAVFSSALLEIVTRLDADVRGSVVLERHVYQFIRQALRDSPELESEFLRMVETHRIPTSVAERCDSLAWWFQAHKERLQRLVDLYRGLGYPAVYAVVRPGEKDFVDLADCLLSPAGGFMLTIDYGASFEALGHSLSVDPGYDGIFIPPVPMDLMADLPHCHGFWPKCAGRIDWTTFVDFTNLAAAGELNGMRTLFYGPQSLLEHVGRLNVTAGGRRYSVPGYSVLAKSWASQHVRSFEGRDVLPDSDTVNWDQRWTSFKAHLMEKPARGSAAPSSVIAFPTWHMDSLEVDSCWAIDPSTMPLADWIRRQYAEPQVALERLTREINDALGKEYALGYEELQLAARLVDWLVATGGCDSLSPRRASQLLHSQGLWLSLRSRILRSWGDVWGEETLVRIARDILQRLASGEPAAATPSGPACVGQQTFNILCVSPGGGSRMWWGD